jgi:acetyl-CoA acetyltransferase
MPNNPSRQAAIVAAAESDEIGYLEDNPKTSMMLHIEAIRNVTEMAGIKISDIEAVGSPGVAGNVAEYLGIDPKWIDTTQIGGCSFQVLAQHMLAAINAGIFEIGVITHGEPGWSRRLPQFRGGGRGGGGGDPDATGPQFEAPYGPAGAPTAYSHALTRHMYQWGSTQADFAQIAVTTREWATLNPRAIMYSKEVHPFGGPITVDEVLNSRVISWPLNLLDCCLVCDHGGAVLITSAAVANSLKTKPVWIAGSGEAMDHASMLEMKDFTATSASLSAGRAYKMAGMGPEDMEMAMIYDSFTVTAGITAEMLGLTPRGEGPSLWADGNAGPGGKFPVNTNGGGLSFNHSGMYGMQLLIESYRQLSGTAEDGVNGIAGKQTNAKSLVVNGTGGSLSFTGTLVLTAD